MTDDRLVEIEARAKSATPGPWEPTPDSRPDIWAYVWAKSGGYDDEGQIIRRLHAAADHVRVHIAELAKYDSANEDAEFIAHARVDVPWLIARVRALEAQAMLQDYPPFCQGCQHRMDTEELDALKAQAERDALLKVTVLGRRQLEKMLYAWQDAHQRDEWGHVYALMCGEVRRARELEEAVLDAALAARDAAEKGE